MADILPKSGNKYCIENVEVPKLQYDDKQDIVVKRIGETYKGLKCSKSLKEYARTSVCFGLTGLSPANPPERKAQNSCM